MNLSEIRPPAGQVKNKRRLGQGMGTGRGKFAGRGAKGAKSISGYSRMRGFEGGQMPLHRRLPKRGFTNAMFKTTYAIVNVATLNDLAGDSFDVQSLMDGGRDQEVGRRFEGSGERRPDPRHHRDGASLLRRGEREDRRPPAGQW